MPAPFSNPEQIGRYRVVRQVGEGGVGIVHAAYDERLDPSVAIEVLRIDSGSRHAVDMLREARVAARMSHPAFCQMSLAPRRRARREEDP